MQTEYDENVLDYWKLPNGIYIVKLRKYDGLDADNEHIAESSRSFLFK